MLRNARLIYSPNTPKEQVFPFIEQIVIGRRRGPSSEKEGRVRIKDPAVSGRHCVIRQAADGRFFIRDESRNGTRVQGRRLVPNVEVEIHPGNRIQVGEKHHLFLAVEPAEIEEEEEEEYEEATRALVTNETEVTILVGDIQGYTTLSQHHKAADVYASVGNVFAALETVVNAYQGTIKEYQGDAIFAFWELDPADEGWHTNQACRAALALQEKVTELATDEEVWTLADSPLAMEWALTTGKVLITAIGGDRPTGLAMVGDAVNYAFRLEKLASEDTGTILVCQHTEAGARDAFEFKSLGELQVAGRDAAEPVFALEGTKQGLEPKEPLTAAFVLVNAEDDPTGDEPGEDEPGEDEPGEDEPGEDEPGEDEPGEE